MLTPSASPTPPAGRAKTGRRAVLGAALATPVVAAVATAAAPAARAADTATDTAQTRTGGSAARAADRHAPSCVADLLPDGA